MKPMKPREIINDSFFFITGIILSALFIALTDNTNNDIQIQPPSQIIDTIKILDTVYIDTSYIGKLIKEKDSLLTKAIIIDHKVDSIMEVWKQ